MYAMRRKQVMFRASIFSTLVGMELGMHTVEPCSSDE